MNLNVTEIVVSAGRTFNHPYEQFSNLRSDATLRAVVAEGVDPVAAVKQLQSVAEGLAEDHKQGLLKSLEQLHDLTERQAEVRGLERMLNQTQSSLDRIRKENPLLLVGEGGAS